MDISDLPLAEAEEVLARARALRDLEVEAMTEAYRAALMAR